MEGRRFVVILIGAGLASSLGACLARAEHTDCRAGYPTRVAWYARPSETPQYVGYYVGGGSAVGGTHRYCDEGTWGWDYRGCILPHRVLLYWSHWRYQGGTGAYRSEGPPVPDIPACAAAAVKKPCHKCPTPE
jgi:hypothetical protein